MSLSILYVEDVDELRGTISELLEEEGREVVAVANGESAVQALETRTFDVIVTDVNLPGMSGTDLARRVLETRPDHWIVICSGYEFRHGLAKLGPNVRSMPKPFEIEDLDALMREIARHLGRAQAAR